MLAAVTLAVTMQSGWAERVEALPDQLEGVGITEKLNDQIPLDLSFKDEEGKPVRLGDFFKGDLPVLLTLNYSNCPMLCSLQLNGLVDGMLGMSRTCGKDFRIITVSIDPKESPSRAKLTRDKYVKNYGRPEAVAGWHFLTGEEANIKALADAVGFGYRYVAERQEYVHAATFIVCTPSGTISRYLYGVKFDSKTIRLSLVEASEGKIATATDQILLYCFQYDAQTGRYAPVAMSIMRLGGGVTVLIFALALGGFWLREYRRKLAASGEESP